MKPLVVKTRAQLLDELRSDTRSLALVPTMGYLHEGHLSLIREGRARAQRVAVSIFVNPAQFGPNEDLARYPRDLEGDVRKCGEAGASLVFAPEDPAEIYPPGFQTWVEVEELSQGLCGASRPGHYRGVATVVCKLLSLFRPQVALFGEKDYQQLKVIERMARDLEIAAWTEIVGVPTVREADGLALSSRNAYLSAEERVRALSLSAALRAAAALHEGGERDASRLIAAARDELSDKVDRVEYVELVDADSLQPVQTVGGKVCLLIAAFVGKTRLIDNRIF